MHSFLRDQVIKKKLIYCIAPRACWVSVCTGTQLLAFKIQVFSKCPKFLHICKSVFAHNDILLVLWSLHLSRRAFRFYFEQETCLASVSAAASVCRLDSSAALPLGFTMLLREGSRLYSVFSTYFWPHHSQKSPLPLPSGWGFPPEKPVDPGTGSHAVCCLWQKLHWKGETRD